MASGEGVAGEQVLLGLREQLRGPWRSRSPSESGCLRLADVDRDHLAVAHLVNAVGEHQALADDAAAVSDLLHLRVQPEIRVRPSSGWLREYHPLVEPGADPRDLRAPDPQPERLDRLVDAAG